MNEILLKKIELMKLIKKHHINSFYSSQPMPELIAVSKQQPDIKIRNALEAGHRVYGENKLAIARWSGFLNIYHDIKLHYIGLQTNKVKALNFLMLFTQLIEKV